MNLIRQLIVKKLEVFDEKTLNNFYDYWSLSQILNMVMANAVPEQKPSINTKLFNKTFSAAQRLEKGSPGRERRMLWIQQQSHKMRQEINTFLIKTQKLADQEETPIEKKWRRRRGRIGLLSYEIE